MRTLNSVSPSDVQRAATRLLQGGAFASVAVGNAQVVKAQIEPYTKVEIMGEIAQRHLYALAAHRLNDQLIYHERLARHHRLISRSHERAHRQIDDLVGAVAKDQLVRLDAKLFRQAVF